MSRGRSAEVARAGTSLRAARTCWPFSVRAFLRRGWLRSGSRLKHGTDRPPRTPSRSTFMRETRATSGEQRECLCPIVQAPGAALDRRRPARPGALRRLLRAISRPGPLLDLDRRGPRRRRQALCAQTSRVPVKYSTCGSCASSPTALPVVAIDQEGGSRMPARAVDGVAADAPPRRVRRRCVKRRSRFATAAVAGAFPLSSCGRWHRVDLAPVVDADSNPANPRDRRPQLGRDPVSWRTRGRSSVLRRRSASCCAANFLDTWRHDADSHLRLPKIAHDLTVCSSSCCRS